MPRGFAGETARQEARAGGISSRSISRATPSARSQRAMQQARPAAPASPRGRTQAAREVESRMSGLTAPDATPAFLKPAVVTVAEAIGGVMGDYLRQGIISRLEAGGTPVREDGIVIGVETNGQYFGRTRKAELDAIRKANIGEGGAQAASPAAQMGAAAPQPDQPAAGPAPTPVVRRSALVQQIEEENRRRRLAGMRRLGSRTLLSGERFDTLGP